MTSIEALVFKLISKYHTQSIMKHSVKCIKNKITHYEDLAWPVGMLTHRGR